jgi:hypothetical protein
MTSEQLIFWSEEHRARITARDMPQDQEGMATDWMARVLALPLIMSDLHKDADHVGLSGKMSRMYYHHGTHADFSDLPQALPKSGILLHGECWTSNILGNQTSQDKDYSWSDIVTQDAPHRYYLSRKALKGK